ncbi:hypothetical protein BJ170DRAFT_616707 [Xylariales sp. AK1849]|nr:hypothetical protein BJ170DRAFT_616707 [Xylariales sp. AK1849]
MKSTTILVVLAVLAPSLVAAVATDIFSACQTPNNGGKKAGDGCSFIRGVASGDATVSGTCHSGAAIGNGLYCSK